MLPAQRCQRRGVADAQCLYRHALASAHTASMRPTVDVMATIGLGVDAGGDVDMAAVGELLADRSRCRMLLALADGRALPASVLASEAGVAPSTASGHLARLTGRGLTEVVATGKYRYYRLAGPEVARLVEVLGTDRAGPPRPVAARGHARARPADGAPLLRPPGRAPRRRRHRRPARARLDRGLRRHRRPDRARRAPAARPPPRGRRLPPHRRRPRRARGARRPGARRPDRRALLRRLDRAAPPPRRPARRGAPGALRRGRLAALHPRPPGAAGHRRRRRRGWRRASASAGRRRPRTLARVGGGGR